MITLAFPTYAEDGVTARNKPVIPEIDRIRLAEAFRLGAGIDDQLWTNWSKAPFAVLLVTEDFEFLLRHPEPSPDFILLGYDSLLESKVYFRKRAQQTGFLATFPAITGSSIPTIVIGEAENTSVRASTPWVVTLLHEHFHQLQFSQPGYYTGVNALNLSHGDQTGMWMLNYPFPYDKKEVQEEFATLSKLLAGAVDSRDSATRSDQRTAFLAAAGHFREWLSPEDYKYLSFQLWQEGIARYTEYKVAMFAASGYKPGKDFSALKDFTSYDEVAKSIRERIVQKLLEPQLGVSKRELFYPFGAAEGLLLDDANPSWRNRYLVDKFDLSRYFP